MAIVRPAFDAMVAVRDTRMTEPGAGAGASQQLATTVALLVAMA